uniref:Uncharacterized protein n=1 Tax=Sphaerodactylus townsendi TaxID=933632 RepID=A0ACB8END2_9SAUR
MSFLIWMETKGSRMEEVNGTLEQMEFKSLQWFGATVRSHGSSILACAPLYSWRTNKDEPEHEVVGTCYLSVNNFTKFVEYAPCRSAVQFTPIPSSIAHPGLYSASRSEWGTSSGRGAVFQPSLQRPDLSRGQGYCQGGFKLNSQSVGTSWLVQFQAHPSWLESAWIDSYLFIVLDKLALPLCSSEETGHVLLGGPGSYFWQGQVLSATQDAIEESYDPGYLVLVVQGQLATRSDPNFSADDSYLGYSVAVGEFSSDSTEDFVAGVPKGNLTHGYVTILNGSDIRSLYNFSGEQMAAYFGYAVAATDINSDGLDDLLIGAPLFMEKTEDGRMQEVGKVYIYLQRLSGMEPTASAVLTGHQEFGRFGSSIAPLGDLDQDGYNDVGIGAPFGGKAQQGVVYVYNGQHDGLHPKPSQVLQGLWPDGHTPDFFGSSMRGAKDLDGNGYPDLIVGAFGVDTAMVYRGRPIVHATATLSIFPTMFNPEERACILEDTGIPVACINLSFMSECIWEAVPDSLHWRQLVQRYLTSARGQGYCQGGFSAEFTKAQIQLDCGEDNVCVPDLQLEVSRDHNTVYLGDKNALNLSFHAQNRGEGGAYEAELHVTMPPEAEYTGVLRTQGNLNSLSCQYDTVNETNVVICDLGNPMKAGTSLWGGLRFTVPRLVDTKKTIQFDFQIQSKNANNSHSEVVSLPLRVEALVRLSSHGVSKPDTVTLPGSGWFPGRGVLREQDVGPGMCHVYEFGNEGPSAISDGILDVSCPIRINGRDVQYITRYLALANCSSNHPVNPSRLQLEPLPTPFPGQDQHFVQRHEAGWSSSSVANGFTLKCSGDDCFQLRCHTGALQRQERATLHLCSRVWAKNFHHRDSYPEVIKCEAAYHVQRVPYKIQPLELPSASVTVSTLLYWAKAETSQGVPLWIIILAILIGLLLLALLIYVLYKLGFFAFSSFTARWRRLNLSHKLPGGLAGLVSPLRVCCVCVATAALQRDQDSFAVSTGEGAASVHWTKTMWGHPAPVDSQQSPTRRALCPSMEGAPRPAV